MIETTGIETLAAAGGLMLALITLIGGWTYWLVRDSERNVRREMELNRQEMERSRQEMERNLRREVASVEQSLRHEMERNRQEAERNHREMLDLLRGHTHGQDDGSPVFRLNPEPGD